jgi:hypothetical protein
LISVSSSLNFFNPQLAGKILAASSETLVLEFVLALLTRCLVKIIHVQLPIIKTRLPKPSKIEYLADE